MLIYSGHGGRLFNHNPYELDKQTDEIWYLYYIQLVDDELNIGYQITTRLTTLFISDEQSIVT